MRQKHKDILKKRLLKGDVRWLAGQAGKFFAVPASYYLNTTVNRPIFGGLVVTYRCNESCPMCNVHLKADPAREMTTAEFLDMADQMAEVGVSGVSITGGEPLVREDLMEIIVRLKSHGIPVSVSTNGLKLQDSDIARRLLLSGLDSVAVSVDGPTPEEHDLSRGRKGAFERTMTGLHNLLELRQGLGLTKKTFVTLATVVNARNHDRFEELLRLATELGVDNVSLNPVHDTSGGGEDKTGIHFKSKDPETSALPAILKDLKSRYPILDSSNGYLDLLGAFFREEPLPVRCYAPYFSLYVDCYKDIIPCGGFFYDSKPVMNLGDRRLVDVWKSEEYEKVRRRLRRCRSCYYSCMAELNLSYAKFP